MDASISLLNLFQGHPVDGSWVFGGFERGSTRCFLSIVDRRDAATLIPLIKKNILPGKGCTKVFRKDDKALF